MEHRHLFLQLSDVHLRADASTLRGSDSLGNLDRAIAQIAASPARPQALVLTGDLADRGEPEAYEMLRRRVGRLGEQLGAQVVYLPGNHDDRTAFRRHLLGPASGTGQSDPSDPSDPIRQVHWFGDLRLVSLDTLVPGDDAGALAPSDLDWLAAQLADRQAECGTVVALHHPPITSPIESMAKIALARPGDLEAVVAGSDVSLVLCGHNHHATTGMLGNIPVFAAPALAYRADAMIESQFVGRPSSAFARIDVVDRHPLVTVIPVE